MALVPFMQPDKYGVIKDIRDFQLAPEAWSDARNIRFTNGRLEKNGGGRSIFSPSIAPYWLLHTFDAGLTSVWILAGLNKVYARIGQTEHNITRESSPGVDEDYSADDAITWNGGVLAGIPILNNSVDVPQMWAPVDATQRLVDLPNWNSNWRAGIIVPFKNFLVALDLTESGTRYVHRIRTSHPAVPGSIPSSWDETDPTNDATLRELTDVNAGPLLYGLPLRDLLILYKERSMHHMQFIGGDQKFRTAQFSEEAGILSRHCAVPDPEGVMHFVATGEDIVLHNGSKPQSLLESRERRWLQRNLSTSEYMRSFCTTNVREKECWFCFPMEGAPLPNMALIWNKESNTVSFRELEELTSIGRGLVPSEDEAWDVDEAAWDSDASRWDTLAHAPFVRELVGARPTATQMLHLDSGNLKADGSNFMAYVERTGLGVVGVTDSGQPVTDFSRRKQIGTVWIEAEGSPFQVRIATQDELGGSLVWSEPKTFTPGVHRKVDFKLSALLWGIRFEQAADATFSVSGYQVDVEPLGVF